jgi:AraC-like DNA-binding protein
VPGDAYREHAPPAALAAHVECFWTTRVDDPSPSFTRVLPDGCSDVIFDFAPAPSRPRTSIVGAMTRAVEVEGNGPADLLGVRFRPGAAASFLRLPLCEVTDAAVDVEALGEGWSAPSRRIHAVESHDEWVALLSAELAARLRAPTDGDRVIAAAWTRLHETAGAVTVRELAAGLGVGERRLQRWFDERVGLTPKQAARIARFRRVVALMLAAPARPLGRVALEAGYYDQPHFNREFARLAGVSPEAWRRERD